MPVAICRDGRLKYKACIVRSEIIATIAAQVSSQSQPFLYHQSKSITSQTSHMDSVLDQIRALSANANAKEQHQIQEQLRDVQREIASNFDLVWGLGSGVSAKPLSSNCR